MNRTEPQSYQDFESLPARAAGVLRAPRDVFTIVIARPRWALVLLATTAVMAACGIGFALTEVGRLALVDGWEATAVAFGQPMDDARYARMQGMSAHGAAYGGLRAIARGPLLAFGAAAVIAAWFGATRGGGATFTQMLAVAAHASVVLAARDVIATPLQYARESMANPVSLGVLFPMLDEASAAARFLGMIDLFVAWWAVVLAIGVSLLYPVRARTAAAAFIGAYVCGALLLAAAMAVAGESV